MAYSNYEQAQDISFSLFATTLLLARPLIIVCQTDNFFLEIVKLHFEFRRCNKFLFFNHTYLFVYWRTDCALKRVIC